MASSYPVDLDSVVQQRSDALVAKVDDEVMMMHPDSGEYFGLNPVAGFIWWLLDEPKSVSDICEAVQSEFEVEADRCVSDTLVFVDQMVCDELLVLSDSKSLAS